MTRQDILKAVQEIFRDVFDDEDLMIEDETNADDIEDWDSFEHISLIIAMEAEFSMKFDIKEVNKLENVGQMIDLIKRKMEE
ncbi:MAG: acyl carrier protein [bacterium]|nr:acyl carrier protein [bacterium]